MCCHPAVSPGSQIALTLRAVGGLTTAEVARAFLVPEQTMTRRLTRAKQTIAESHVPFRMPSAAQRPERLRAVLHTLYLIFNEGYVATAGLSWRPMALSLAARHLPDGKSARRLRVDGIGTALVIAATGLLVFPLIEGRDLGWPIWAYAMLGTSALLLGVFAWWQRRAERVGSSPLVVPALFRHRSFSLGLVVSLLLFATVACLALTFTLLLQLGYRFSAIHTVLTGLFITVGILVTAGAMSKKIIPALGRWSLTIGIVIMGGGNAAVGLIADGPGLALSSWRLAPALLILGAGMGMVVVPLLPFILSSVDPDDAGSASGVANVVQQIGGALGVALIGAVFFRQLGTAASYGHAFMAGIRLQLALLSIAAFATIFLPARIANAFARPEAREAQVSPAEPKWS